MDEIKAFVDKAEGMSKDELIKAFPVIIEKAKQVGFAKVVKEVPTINEVIRSRMKDFEVDEAIDLMKQFLPVMFDAMKELVEGNEDVQDELEDIEDTSVTMIVEDASFAMTIIIEEGKLDVKMEEVPDVDLVLKLSKDAMKGIMSGESDAMQAYMSGEVKAEGNLTKAMALRSIFEVIGEEFGFEMM